MTDLTKVELIYIEGKVERWIRFGHASSERVVDRRQRVFAFAPGATFAFVRWSANDYGTVASRIDVMRAATGSACVVQVPGVVPGGESLLRIAGWPRVQKVLLAIDQIEALGLQPETICPDHWRHVHSRLIAGLRHRDYTLERHRAWRMRERIAV